MRRIGLCLWTCVVSSLAGCLAASAADVPVKARSAQPIPSISGYLSVYGGGSRASVNEPGSGFGLSDTLLVYGGDGRVNAWFSPSASVQLDAEAEGTGGVEGIDGDDDTTGGRLSGLFGGHITWRDPHAYAAGLFGAVAGHNHFSVVGSSTYGIAGVEGQRYFGNATLFAQAGHIARISGPTAGGGDFEFSAKHGWLARLQGRYFVTPNDKLTAEIGFARLHHNFEQNLSGNLDIMNWGVSYEHRFGSSPWAAFVEYAGFQNKASSWTDGFAAGDRATEHMVLLGVRAHFGDATLLAQDRTGATFDLPKFIRAMPWTCLLVCEP